LAEANLRILHWPLWAASKERENGDAHALAASDKRHALRLPVAIHVLIYGRLGNEPFSEHTETIDVCTLGGLVPISTRVRRSQRLILTNLQTNEELACRVVHLAKAGDGGSLAGLAFLQPGPRFWRSGPLTDSPSTADLF
jgi:hypothetical protein